MLITSLSNDTGAWRLKDRTNPSEMENINQKVLPIRMPFNKSLQKAFILFCGITILVMCVFYLRRTTSTDDRGRTHIDDRSYLWQNATNPLNNFSSKLAVENMKRHGKKIFIAFNYWEQLTMGTNNFFDLTALAAYGGRRVVVPLVNDSKFHGLPTEKGIKTLELYYNVSALNRTLRARGHGTLISWKEFQDVCQGKLDVLVRIDYTKLKKSTAYNQATRPFFPCNDSHTDTISTDFKVEKTICMNVFAVDSVEKFENEVVERLPCVGLDQWRGSKRRNRFRAQFQLSPLVTNRLGSLRDAAVFFNPKLLHIARDFITKHLGPLFVSVHVRAERILSTFKNITAVVRCLSNLVTQVQSHKKDSKAHMPVFLAADFADYGSSSKQVEPARENAESLMKILAPLKPVIFQPSVYNLTDRGTVAIVEMNILVLGTHLSVAGGGKFQAWILNQFVNKNNIDQRYKANCRSKMCNYFCYL
ncbi:uncharacterized protein LOC110066707 [Orbicella faveolata]|uniref:uncharacterized protein LOC110066707 n=1 Tax=Orbicella faveolata TaxID=48498 RepID=UPI0009E39150|nr:uncharacterized protein LOC110066707 [Orbicella faveolata]